MPILPGQQHFPMQSGIMPFDNGGSTIGGMLVTYGTFTANGASAVTVANAAVTSSSIILITLKTVGGTVGAIPVPQTVTPGTGFTIAGTASDTSVYSYAIFG